MFAIVGAIVINITDILALIWYLAQPRTPFNLVTCVWIYPDISSTDKTIYMGPEYLPKLYFVFRCR